MFMFCTINVRYVSNDGSNINTKLQNNKSCLNSIWSFFNQFGRKKDHHLLRSYLCTFPPMETGELIKVLQHLKAPNPFLLVQIVVKLLIFLAHAKFWLNKGGYNNHLHDAKVLSHTPLSPTTYYELMGLVYDIFYCYCTLIITINKINKIFFC